MAHAWRRVGAHVAPLAEPRNMFRYQGLIDFSTLGAISAGALPLELQGDLLDVSLPGIELRWKRRLRRRCAEGRRGGTRGGAGARLHAGAPG